MKYGVLAGMFLVGCAQAGQSTTGGPHRDLSVADAPAPPPDLYGLDLFGVDLANPPSGDLAMKCDVIAQTGCGINEKCIPSTSGNYCGSLGATQVPTGGLCGNSMVPPATTDECVAGDGCVGISNFDGSKTIDVCHQFCKLDSDCKTTFPGGPAPRCNANLSATTEYKACTLSCNPVGAADGTQGCPTGLACGYIINTMPTAYEFTDCLFYGTVAEGGDCTAHGSADCQPGLTCVSLSGPPVTNTCRKVCLLSAGSGQCPVGGQMCLASSMLTSPQFGVCL